MSKILDFPKVIAYVIKDAFYHEEPKVVQLSDYQKNSKAKDEEIVPYSVYPKKIPSQSIEDDDEDEDDDEILDEGDYRDSSSNADKAIYFSSFISF